MKISRIRRLVGGVCWALMLSSAPSIAQDAGESIEIKVSLTAENIVSSVPAIAVMCSVDSSVVASTSFIGIGATALYFEGDPEDLLVFDPTQGDFRFTQVIAANREQIPSEISVKILPTGDTAISAWTNGICSFGLFDPRAGENNFRAQDYWEIDAYEVPRNCEDVEQSALFACSNPETHARSFASFTRPGFTDAD